MYISSFTQKNIAPNHRWKTSDSYLCILINDIPPKIFIQILWLIIRNAGAKKPAYPMKKDENVVLNMINVRIFPSLSVLSISWLRLSSNCWLDYLLMSFYSLYGIVQFSLEKDQKFHHPLFYFSFKLFTLLNIEAYFGGSSL